MGLGVLIAPGCDAAKALLNDEQRRDVQLQPGVVYISVSYSFTIRNYTFSCPSSGTGFIYRPDGYVITNGHVVELARLKDLSPNAVDAFQRHIAACTIGTVEKMTDEQKEDVVAKIREAVQADPSHLFSDFRPPQITVYLSNNSHYSGEIKAYSDSITEGGKDVAIIKIDGKNLPTVPLGDSDEVRVGDQIVVIGYPGAAVSSNQSILVPSVTHGKVSAVNKKDEKGTPVIQSETAINAGNSGGPAFSETGRVIGIATYKTAEAGINWFIPINTAMEFVRQAGALPQSGPFDDLWKRALDAYQHKHWSNAHALMGNVLEAMPGLVDASTLQKQATENYGTMNWFEKVEDSVETADGPVQVGGALILVAFVIGGVVFARSNKKSLADGASSSNGRATVIEPGARNGQLLGTLHVVTGPSKGKQYAIPKDGLRIGRDPEACTVVFDSDKVGREHCWVMPMTNGDVAVIDRGSVNHTYVNSIQSAPVSKVVLKHGDRIFICHDNPIELVYYKN
jgi:hypothetical protein